MPDENLIDRIVEIPSLGLGTLGKKFEISSSCSLFSFASSLLFFLLIDFVSGDMSSLPTLVSLYRSCFVVLAVLIMVGSFPRRDLFRFFDKDAHQSHPVNVTPTRQLSGRLPKKEHACLNK